MKTTIIISVVIFSLAFASCQKSGNLIGEFTVTEKVSQKERTSGLSRAIDFGDVYLVSSHNDTIRSYVTCPEVYLNTKVGDVVLVSKDNFGYTINNRVKKYEVGYCRIVKKINTFGTNEFDVVTRGNDTIRIYKVPEIVYFNSSVGDSAFIKKYRTGDYYTE